jgi:hypothetical protein
MLRYALTAWCTGHKEGTRRSFSLFPWDLERSLPRLLVSFALDLRRRWPTLLAAPLLSLDS